MTHPVSVDKTGPCDCVLSGLSYVEQLEGGTQGGTPAMANPSDSCGEGPSHAASGSVFNVPFDAQYVEFAFWGRQFAQPP